MMEAREVPVCLLVLLFCAASCWLMASAVQVDRVWQARCRLGRRAQGNFFLTEIFSFGAHARISCHKTRCTARWPDWVILRDFTILYMPMIKIGQTLHVGHLIMIKDELGVLYFISFRSYGQ